ncbi:uncharacterized protein C10orf62 homolog [Panthera pardus]|uniref:Uncharacterized protein C10orf62 homolog n=2 Tax=Panthera TaxID=9688 RepID=A0A9V1G3W9_PANPR|nr:uncharacterized protein C10orf62 homolog [Panthera pardus]
MLWPLPPHPPPQPPSSQWGSLLRWEGHPRKGTAGALPARQPLGIYPFKHEPYHPGSSTPSVLLALPAQPRVLEAFLELIQQPSCKVVLGTALLLGGGGLMLWIQRKRRRKASAASAQNVQEPPECHKAKNENWIKSHFSRLSEERLAACSSTATPPPESGSGEASTTIHMETLTTRQREAGTTLRRESFTSKQRTSGASVTKETHKESAKSSSTDEPTWAAVAACTKEIDTLGQQLANSMLQRAIAYQNSGHLESRDVNQEELKALEEVELKLKGNFLTQRETTVAGANHTHAIHGHGHYGHQGHLNHQSHSLPNRSHQTYHPFEAT